jgi:3-oxo-5alpha-steroid 4-dehydrogenase
VRVGAVAWDDVADVVVVGFGAAGACAAIEAAEAGVDVLVLDRFDGGGASALSGGVVYAGGGTRVQHAAGVPDSVDAMYDYLRTEVGDAVSPATLRRFCEGSPAMIAWLEEHGVPFAASLCPYKTSYPTNRHYLYVSGSELSTGDKAARGHRTYGRGTSGRVLYAGLAAASGASRPGPCAARRRGSASPTGSGTPGRASRTCTCRLWVDCCTGRWPGWSGVTAVH